MWSGCASGSMRTARCGTGCRSWWSSVSSLVLAARIRWRTYQFTWMRLWRSGLRSNTVAHPRGDHERVGREVRGPIEQMLRAGRCRLRRHAVDRIDGLRSPTRCRGSSSTWPPSVVFGRRRSGAYRHHLDRFEDYLTRIGVKELSSCRRRCLPRSSPNAARLGWPRRRFGRPAGCCGCSCATRTAKVCSPAI